MIEIIALIFLTRHVGRLAAKKGEKPSTWKIYTVIGWFFFEIIGFFIGLMIFGKDDVISAILIGFAFAITSYYFIIGRLNKLPDYRDPE